MSNDEDYHNAGGLCVDGYAETLVGSELDEDGELLMFVVASCGATFMPCEPYKPRHSVPITCAICTR